MATAPTSGTTEPIERVVKRYVCPFCHRGRSSRRATVDHIGRCWLNPAVRSCRTCAHFDRGDPGDLQFGDPGTDESCKQDVPGFAMEQVPLSHCSSHSDLTGLPDA